MTLVRKLKPDRKLTGAIIPLSMLPIFGIVTLIFDLSAGLVALAVMMWGFALFYFYAFIRTKNAALLVICLDGAFFGVLLMVLESQVSTASRPSPEFKLAYLTGLIFFGVVLVSLAFTRKLKWRGREVFELAAESVDDQGHGYTPRPRPVGKVDYNLQQLHGFAHFCAQHMVALPYITSKNITLVPVKMGDEFGRLLGLSGDYRDASWVTFDVEGEVSVHISQGDYLDYREPLAFDQLCTSFGQLFIDFFELYNRGEGTRIVDRLDELKINIFS